MLAGPSIMTIYDEEVPLLQIGGVYYFSYNGTRKGDYCRWRYLPHKPFHAYFRLYSPSTRPGGAEQETNRDIMKGWFNSPGHRQLTREQAWAEYREIYGRPSAEEDEG